MPLMPDPVRRYYERERPIELRPVEFSRYLGAEVGGRALPRVDPRDRQGCPTIPRSTNACSPTRPT